MTFDSILVANRGEIACRVIRTARGLGYRTIAVYSEADAGACHVAMADDAVLIGPPPVAESYLDIDRILAAVERTGAQAIHPGYGFLSENAAFARACDEAGVLFIGPDADVIEAMGNKAAAKRIMTGAGVPCVPGYFGEAQDDDALLAAADGIGFPIMVKAAAGGGGRGMRLVTDATAMRESLALARSEAENAFGSGELILEKALNRPRHVEFQVFGDRHGSVIHLGERDCSIQRRHQKIVEESPCPVMTDALREHMAKAAVTAARAIGYVGAGTVEFLLGEDGEFYFLEMNTRLQVEHPVTEMVTGQDLVAWQIAVARGEALPLSQGEVGLDGHAIEVRLYAEDPAADFTPDSGRIEVWRAPCGEDVRVDDGIASGQQVTPFYDAMVAKIIGWGPSREVARQRLLGGLHETALFGVKSNRDYLIEVLRDERFASGQANTAFVEETSDARSDAVGPDNRAVAAVMAFRAANRQARARSVRVSPELNGWGSGGSLVSPVTFVDEDGEANLTVRPVGAAYSVADGQSNREVEVDDDDGQRAEVQVDGRRHVAIYHHDVDGRTWLSLGGVTSVFVRPGAGGATASATGGDGRVAAPMHGVLQAVLVEAGQSVTAGQPLAVIEAMKMQHEISAPIEGEVAAVHGKVGIQMAAGDPILEVRPERVDTMGH